MICGIGNHQLKDPVYLTSASMIKLVKRRFPEFRQQNQVCLPCKNAVVYSYMKRKKIKSKMANSSDKLSTLSAAGNVESSDNVDRIVNTAPTYFSQQIPADTPVRGNSNQSNDNGSSNNNSSSTFSMDVAELVNSPLLESEELLNSSKTPKAPNKTNERPPLKDINTSNFIRTPATTGSAKRKRIHNKTNKNTNALPTPNSSLISIPQRSSSNNITRDPLALNSKVNDSDDDVPLVSINVANGVRLPDIQPAPKRRPFHHISPEVMDVYLSGITGG